MTDDQFSNEIILQDFENLGNNIESNTESEEQDFNIYSTTDSSDIIIVDLSQESKDLLNNNNNMICSYLIPLNRFNTCLIIILIFSFCFC